MPEKETLIEKRKNEHLSICLNEKVGFSGVTTGFENYFFKHLAMPDVNFSDISLRRSLFNKSIRTPFLISSMTGGTKKSQTINQRLALAAEKKGWTLALGSIRPALEQEYVIETYKVREQAPTVPVIANVGLVQLNYGLDIERLRRTLKDIEADALVLHLNSMQEVFQPEGDINFKGLWDGLTEVLATIDIPIGIKEVGMGLDQDTIKRLNQYPISFIDVAGAGGTSWIEVEKYRSKDKQIQAAAEAFEDWGIPTSVAIKEAKEVIHESLVLFASGGIRNGVDAAKAIALGAHVVGLGRALLADAMNGNDEQLVETMAQFEFELRAAMFGIGASSLEELAHSKRLFKK